MKRSTKKRVQRLARRDAATRSEMELREAIAVQRAIRGEPQTRLYADTLEAELRRREKSS